MEDRILVVDDEELVRELVRRYLVRVGFDVESCGSVSTAMELLENEEFAVVVTDKNMMTDKGDEEGGMQLLRHIKKNLPLTEVIMMTGYATVETAIEAMRMGAFDYIIKPFPNEELKKKIERIFSCRSFLNPERAVRVYKVFHDNVLKLLESSVEQDDKALLGSLQDLEVSIDSFITAQKDWERIILLQQEALAHISARVEQLMESMDPESDQAELVQSIIDHSMHRI